MQNLQDSFAEAFNTLNTIQWCLGGAAVWVHDFQDDQAVVGSIPGPGIIKSLRSTQPSIPLG